MNRDKQGRFVKGFCPWNTGKIMSPEIKEVMNSKVYLIRRGKTYEEIYGSKKAKVIKDKIKESFTPDKKKIISNTHKGIKLDEEHKRKIGLGNMGRIVNQETRDKIRTKLLGHKPTEETKQKMSLALKGKRRSIESIERGKATVKYQYANNLRLNPNLGKKLSEKEKQRLSESLKLAYKTGKKKPVRMMGKANPFYGKHHSEEIMKRIILANSGENSHKWNGGSSFEPYDINFNNRFKRAIRKRDNHICMLCNTHQEKLSRTLSIHHIDYNKELSIPQNCISLCLSCHSKTNDNRPNWTKFFQDLLSQRYGYKYENKDIVIGVKNE